MLQIVLDKDIPTSNSLRNKEFITLQKELLFYYSKPCFTLSMLKSGEESEICKIPTKVF